MASRLELVNFIRYQLVHALPADNAHHEFETICRAVARARIARNILPASGPVSAGGDGGLDFETFKSYLDEGSEPPCAFLAQTSSDYLAFACTTQKKDVESKIAADVKSIKASEPDVDRIYAMCTATVPTGQRRKLRQKIKKAHGVAVEVHDVNWLAENLADDDLFRVARDHLKVPEHMRPEPPVAITSGPGYSVLPPGPNSVPDAGPSGRRRYEEMHLALGDSRDEPDLFQTVSDIVTEQRELAAAGSETEAAGTLWSMASALVESGLPHAAIELLDDLDNIVPPGRLPPAEDAWRHNVRALALAGLGQREQADALWRQMLASGKRLDEPELKAVALQNLATSDIIRGEFETAKCNIAESMKLMEDLGRLRSIAQLLNSVVLLAIDEGDYAHAASVLDTYEDVARTNRDVSLLTSAHGNRGRLLVQHGELLAAEAEFKTALRLSKQTGDAVRVILSLQNLGAVCAEQGRLGDALRWYRKGIRGAELYELDVHVEVLQRSLAVVLDRAGRHRDALAAFDAARQAARKVGDEDLWAQSTMNIGAVHILAADPESALEPLTDAISAFRKLGEYEKEAHARRNRAAAYVALGRNGEAVSEARRAADLHPASEHQQRAELLTYAAETALSDGDMLQTAIELFEESLTEEEAFSQPSDLARHGVLIGASLIEHGAGESAVAFYDRALNAVENVPEGQEMLPSVLNERGIAFERLGRHDDAHRELRRCIELVDGTGDPNARKALANLVEVERQRGEVSEAVALGRQAVREALAAHDEDALFHAFNNLWLALLEEDEPGSVQDAARELPLLLTRPTRRSGRRAPRHSSDSRPT